MAFKLHNAGMTTLASGIDVCKQLPDASYWLASNIIIFTITWRKKNSMSPTIKQTKINKLKWNKKQNRSSWSARNDYDYFSFTTAVKINCWNVWADILQRHAWPLFSAHRTETRITCTVITAWKPWLETLMKSPCEAPYRPLTIDSVRGSHCLCCTDDI